MKRTFLAAGLVTLCWMNAFPQSKNQPKSKPPSRPKTTVSISGTSFDEKHFVSDPDLKIWTVTNQSVLEGYACEHVRITAQLDPANDTMMVKSIKVVAATPKTPSNDDYMKLN
jgi:hypothetical protein